MSQRFIIDININGQTPASGQGDGNGISNSEALGAMAIGSSTLSANRMKAMANKFETKQNMGLVERGLARVEGVVTDISVKESRNWSADWIGQTQYPTETGSTSQPWQKTAFAGSKVDQKMRASVGPAAIAAGWKAAQTYNELKAYTSGDAYANAQRANSMKRASYAAALAISGPMAPLIAAGIAGNEAFSAFTDNYKYNYDRKLERAEITNITQIAGNISYGRNRGGN